MVKKYFKKAFNLLFNSCRPLICSDIRIPAAKYNWPIKVIHEEIGEELFKKLNGDPYFLRDFQSNLEYQRNQVLVNIPWGRIRDRIGFVFLPNGSVCSEANWSIDYMISNASYSKRFKKTNKVHGDVFTLLGIWSDAYYHWFHDTLPRLINSLPCLPENCRFLIQSQPKDYQIQSLLALGINKKNLLIQNDCGDTLVERLWFATPHAYTTFGGTKVIGDVANKISKYIKCAPQKDTKCGRIYISRAKAPCRRILNEEELFPMLKKHGFHLEILEKHSFRKQVQIVSGSDIIIGPHGAGLVNLIFMPNDGKVIEIAGKDVVNCYGFMTEDSGRVFARFPALQNGLNGDYYVNPEEFNHFLCAFLRE